MNRVADTPKCAEHAEATAVGACARCGRPGCDECLPLLLAGRLACGACANAARAQGGRPWGFAAMVLLTGGACSLALVRAETSGGGEPSYALYIIAGALILGISGFIVSRKRAGEHVETRQLGEMIEEPPDPNAAGGPYRAPPPRRRFLPRAPPLSGRLTAVALTLCFAFTALAAPVAMHVPKWLEAEVVLGAWWLTWTVALAVLLYRGRHLSDDHKFSPALWFAGNKKQNNKKNGGGSKSSGSGGSSSWSLGLGDLSSVDGEGCLYVLAAILLAGVAVLTAWLLVELVVPALFTLAYMLLIRALTRVTNQAHACKGDPLRAARTGALYATLYVMPLAAIVLVVHEIISRRGH